MFTQLSSLCAKVQQFSPNEVLLHVRFKSRKNQMQRGLLTNLLEKIERNKTQDVGRG